MKRISCIFFLIIFQVNFLLAQEQNTVRIDSALIKKTLEILASDSLEGRAPFTPGIEKAASYIRDQMQQFGLKPMYPHYNDTVYRQDVNLVGILSAENTSNLPLVVGSHYDHIGIEPGQADSIANGANDNASGVAVMLALAKYFSENKNSPPRDIIFAAFTLEEQGLYGSRHLAERWQQEGKEVFAVVNFDMLGSQLPDQPGKAYATGFYKSEMNQMINGALGDSLILDLPFSEQYGLFRMSDNYPFYQVLNIPSHTFSTFNFKNYPYYHQVSDETEKLDLENLYQVAENFIDVIEFLANTDQTIKLQESP